MARVARRNASHGSHQGNRNRRLRRRLFRPFFELLETRLALTTFTVNSTADLSDANLADGVCDTDVDTAGEQCTLRAAMQQAAAMPNSDSDSDGSVDPDLIHFNVPANDAGHVYYRDDGVARQVSAANVTATSAADDLAIGDMDPDWPHSWFTIRPSAALPLIGEPVILDGYTQPGSSANTNTVASLLGLNTVLRIELDGSSVETRGLEVVATAGQPTATTVRGLVINSFGGGHSLIFLRGSSDPLTPGTVISGNFIGTDVSGTRDRSGVSGVRIESGSSSDRGNNNSIGGTSAADRNLISGNSTGIRLDADPRFGGEANHNLIQGNLIGSDASGTGALRNDDGIALRGPAHHNTIGGTAAGARNLISSSNGSGINIGPFFVAPTGNLIQGNFIGTDVRGTSSLGNNGAGIQLDGSDTTIGGPAESAGNVIAFNNSAGISLAQSSTGIAILRNSVHSNRGLGIDLGPEGVTFNDAGDSDGGANRLQNFPVLTSVAIAGTTTTVSGTLDSTPNRSFRIELFASSAADGSGFGEGPTFLGSIDASTDAGGLANFTTSGLAELTRGQNVLTATATDLTTNETSEFSRAIVLPVQVTVNTTADGSASDAVMTLREAIAIANGGSLATLTPRELDQIRVRSSGEKSAIFFDIPASDARHSYYQDDGNAGQVTLANIQVTAATDDIAIPDIDPDWAHSWFSIQPTSALPTITRPVIIDGHTQPGSSPNTNTVESLLGLNSVIKIELDGSGTSFANGLLLETGGNGTVRGLVVNRFSVGVRVRGDDVIEGNFIGTDPSGTLARGNGVGVFIDGSFGVGSNNTIGGTTAAARNLISGSTGSGGIYVEARAGTAVNNLVQGNLIGTDSSGTRPVRNSHGVFVTGGGATNNTIGGAPPSARNVISANSENGIVFSDGFGGASGNFVQGNFIGTDVTGTARLGNSVGISLSAGTSNTTIGGATAAAHNVISGNNSNGIDLFGSNHVVQGNFIGTAADGMSPLGNTGYGLSITQFDHLIGGVDAGAGNRIAFNGSDGVYLTRGTAAATRVRVQLNAIFSNAGRGVYVESGTDNAILSNSIFNNGLLGIDLFGGAGPGGGVSDNDPGDADSGPNALQNFPMLTGVVNTGAGSVAFGTLDSTPLTDFVIQFFGNTTLDPTGFGEGQTFLGETVVKTSSAGTVDFAAELAAPVPNSTQVTATATRLLGGDGDPTTPLLPAETSEFSPAIGGAASELHLGQSITGNVALRAEARFFVNVPPAHDARLRVAFANPQIGEVFIHHGEVPDTNNFLFHAVAFIQSDSEFFLPGSPAPYLILIRGMSGSDVPSGQFTLSAEELGAGFVGKMAPDRGSNLGQVTIGFGATGLSSSAIISLVAADGTAYPATHVVRQTETSFFATFNLVGLAPGFYDLRAADGPRAALRIRAFEVTAGPAGQFVASITTPDAIRNGWQGKLVIEYANVGETDIPAPFITVNSFTAAMVARFHERPIRASASGGSSSGGGGGTAYADFFPPPFPPPPVEPEDPIAQFLAISQSGLAGVLPPGAHERIDVFFQDNGNMAPDYHGTLEFELVVTTPRQEGLPFDLAEHKDELRPEGVDPAAWDVVFNNLVTRFGGTVGSYLQALRDAANYLSRFGVYEDDISRLLGFYLQQADGALPGQSPAAAIDAVAPATGLPLVWGRSFAPTISRRFDLGPMGRGWSHPWDFQIVGNPDLCSRYLGPDNQIGTFDDDVFNGQPAFHSQCAMSDVVIRTPGGTRRFVPTMDTGYFEDPIFGLQVSRRDVRYEGVLGDLGVLTYSERRDVRSGFPTPYEGTFRLVEFPAGPGSPSICFARSAFGCQSAASIVAGLPYFGDVVFTDGIGSRAGVHHRLGKLDRIVHSNGDQFTLAHTGDRLTELTDQAGRVTRFEYDLTEQYLTRVVAADGTTTQYTYDTTPGSPSLHALTSVTHTDGTRTLFEYDNQGRLMRITGDGGTQPVTFSYGHIGELFVTDASGAASSLLFNHLGQLLHAIDPLGRSIDLAYDSSLRLDRLTLPENQVFLFDWAGDRLTNLVKSDGTSIRVSHNSSSIPSEIRDERGIPLRFTGGGAGPESVIHADSTREQFTYGTAGVLTRSINRRGQAIHYTSNSRGQVVRKDHDDGSFETFTYDDRGNLLTATDDRGTMSFEYDSGDRLTRVTYPNGRSLRYVYDAAGRPIRLEDHADFAVNYAYDALGRLERLTDGSGTLIVAYTIDGAGGLIREDRGNGTFTTYDYDLAGQLTSLVHHAPDGSVSSRFDYTYDVLGRRTSMTTLEGLTTYGYDTIGQLTSVTLPDGRMIQYEYDPAGNRIAVTDNGVRTEYTTNDLNQYTRVGSLLKAYDADGNLVCEASSIEATCSGGMSYAYDDENRLIRVGDTQYEYDVLGNRIAKIENGVRMEFLVDPTGLTDVVAEYDTAGNAVARYVYAGAGLVSRQDASGSVAFYDYDAVGSTVAITGTGGTVLNRYSYLPFGEPLTHTETVSNPFEYVGRFGVERNENGLDFMRARFYASTDGRFISEDPLGIGGGDLNLYAYVFNDPASEVDPTGTTLLSRLNEIGRKKLVQILLTVITKGKISPDKLRPLEPKRAPSGQVVGAPPNSLQSVIDPVTLLCNITGHVLCLAATIGTAIGTALRDAIPELQEGNELTFWGDLACDLFACDEPDLEAFGVPGELAGKGSTRQVSSLDPNDIVGPAGFGAEQFVRGDNTLPYTIRFENLARATAPAQTVVVNQQLDPDLDLATFELQDVGLGASFVQAPAERSAYSARFDLGPEKNLYLDIAAQLNYETGVITWTFTSLDPATLESPDNPLAGFLPPNQMPPQGEGFVSYLIRPKSGLPTGTRIDAQATVVFDGSPLDTPPIFHTLDSSPPRSRVETLPAVTNSTSFTVSWSGTDDAQGAAGSGIAFFDIFVSDNNAPFTLWQDNTADTSALFAGAPGHTYSFYSVATDNVGHGEMLPTQAQATTTVVESDSTPPMLTKLDLVAGARKTIAAIVLTFSEALRHEAAENPSNYRLALAGKDKVLGTADDVRTSVRASYDSDSWTVQLRSATPLKMSQAFQLSVSATNGLNDEAGNWLDGDADGTTGGDYVAIIGTRFSYRDNDRDLVSLALSNGGLMRLTRRPDGDGQTLAVGLLGSVSTATSLTGKVKPPRAGGSDRCTRLPLITGLGPGSGNLQRCTATAPGFQISSLSATIVDRLLESNAVH